MKTQVLNVAGDMGSAMRLLSEYAFQGDYKLFQEGLQFFLDLMGKGIQGVTFFWPGLHLQMLPPLDIDQLREVESMEDFLLTVATKYSVHLALKLIWGSGGLSLLHRLPRTDSKKAIQSVAIRL